MVVLSHLGRPKGRPDPGCSLRPVAERLGELLAARVHFHPELTGPGTRSAVDALAPGEILVLENTRFDPGEEKNDTSLAGALAEFADLFVNDAFGAAHRAHASTAALPERVRARGGRAVAGLLMEKELDLLGQPPRRAGAPLRRDPRRCQDLREDRYRAEPPPARGPPPDRRRNGEHVLPRARARCGRLARRGRPD